MLAAENMLKFLSNGDDKKDYKNCNNDYDFSEVLEFCGDTKVHSYKLRYPDGQEKEFSFDS